MGALPGDPHSSPPPAGGARTGLAKQFPKALQIHIAPADDHAHALARQRLAGFASRRKTEAARRLHNHLHALGKKPHRGHQLRIADGQHLIDIAPS